MGRFLRPEAGFEGIKGLDCSNSRRRWGEVPAGGIFSLTEGIIMPGCADPLLVTGTLLVKAGLVAKERLQASIWSQIGHRAARWPGKKLGYHLVCEGAVGREALEKLLAARDAEGFSAGEALLGKIAVRNGFLSEGELAKCLSHQESERAAGRETPPLGHIIRRRGLMDEHELQAVIDRQRTLVELSELRAG